MKFLYNIDCQFSVATENTKDILSNSASAITFYPPLPGSTDYQINTGPVMTAGSAPITIALTEQSVLITTFKITAFGPSGLPLRAPYSRLYVKSSFDLTGLLQALLKFVRK